MNDDTYFFVVNNMGQAVCMEFDSSDAEEMKGVFEENDPYNGPYEIRRGRVVLEE